MHRFVIALSIVLASTGCQTATVRSPRHNGEPREDTSLPPGGGARNARVVSAIEVGGRVEGALGGAEGSPAYVAVLARGAQVTAALTLAERSALAVYGPLASDWRSAPAITRGGARVELTAPADGAYLFEVQGTNGSSATFSLELTCNGAECRVTCGPEQQCPAGAACALVQCIRAPCPSYCEPVIEQAPPAAQAGVGAPCGTRGAFHCAEGLICIRPESAACGEYDAPGACQLPVTACTREYRPVCGCDGQTYPNECSAHAAGQSVRSSAGPCPTAGPPAPGAACERGGCGGELCHEPGEGRASICVARPEHACYPSATCERQADGRCGWTQTAELRACLASPPPMR